MNIEQKARDIAHEFSPQCRGGTGYGPGGDGPRWHSKRCDTLALRIRQALNEAIREHPESPPETSGVPNLPPNGGLPETSPSTRLRGAETSGDDAHAKEVLTDEFIDALVHSTPLDQQPQ